jgi:hypothetical protein
MGSNEKIISAKVDTNAGSYATRVQFMVVDMSAA